jgi:hypothetical protein
MADEHFLAVDKVHESDAVIVDDHGRAFTVPLAQLPPGVAERTVLRVVLGDAGTPDWSSAAVDETETRRRMRRSQELTDKLMQADEYGFLHPEGES